MGVEPAPLPGTDDAGRPGARHPRGPLPKKLLLSSSRKNPHRKSMARGSGPPRSDEPQGVSGQRTRVLQEDGKLRCPAGASLWLSEVRQENAFTKAGRLPGLPDGLSTLFFARAVSGKRR